MHHVWMCVCHVWIYIYISCVDISYIHRDEDGKMRGFFRVDECMSRVMSRFYWRVGSLSRSQYSSTYCLGHIVAIVLYVLDTEVHIGCMP